MKTAVLISGHMRSFDRCLPTLHWHVFRHFVAEGQGAGGKGQDRTCDFFVSTEPDEDAPKAELLRAKYPHARVEIDLTPQPRHIWAQITPPMPEAIFHNTAAYAPYAISVPVEAVLGQLWRLQRCWDFFRSCASALGYCQIIRCRPDLWFESSSLPRGPIHMSAYLGERDKNVALTPWWGRFGGVNDRFAICGRDAAVSYFGTWVNLPALLAAGCPLHPESLVKASLEAGGCTIDDTLDVSFSTLRANGERRFPEISAQDIAAFDRK